MLASGQRARAAFIIFSYTEEKKKSRKLPDSTPPVRSPGLYLPSLGLSTHFAVLNPTFSVGMVNNLSL